MRKPAAVRPAPAEAAAPAEADLEPTYTANAFAAFVAAARSGRYGKNLLFWITFNSIDSRNGIDHLPDPKQLPAPFQRFWKRG